MSSKGYIESGMIESYVMGLSSLAESEQVASLMASDPEVAAEVSAFELLLEKRLLSEAIPAPDYLREILINAVSPEPIYREERLAPENTQSKVIALHPRTQRWKYVASVSVGLLVVSAWLNLHYFKKYTVISLRYNTLLANQNSLLANLNASESKLKGIEDVIKILVDPNVKPVLMLPPDKSKGAIATAYWNRFTKSLYLLQKNLPTAPAGKQYQLWALVKGKPVNAGIIDDCRQVLCKMTDVTEADAFAITLEKSGGSPAPDLTQLKVIGSI